MFVYLAGAQLLLSASWRSALAGGCGLLVGAAYQYNFLGLKQLKVSLMPWYNAPAVPSDSQNCSCQPAFCMCCFFVSATVGALLQFNFLGGHEPGKLVTQVVLQKLLEMAL